MKAPRILFAAPKSGSGKTMITCGIIELLKRREKKVSSFKCGPDYIDPMFHRRVLGISSGNLDTYFTDEATTRYLLMEKAIDSDITVLEGVMGFYDGIYGTSVGASTYEVAKVTASPVILVVDGKGASVTLASVIKGIREFRKDSGIAGVILNRISAGYYARIAKVIEEICHIPVLGYFPEIKNLKVPERHLGLIAPEEMEAFEEWIALVANTMEQTIDMDQIIALAESASCLEVEGLAETEIGHDKKPDIYHCSVFGLQDLSPVRKGIRIGVAKDEAFSFYYAENLDLLKKMGADIVDFSPVHDKHLPPDLQGLILGGGYPEHYGKQLSRNITMREEIKTACRQIPVLAECGGFLYLQQSLEADDDIEYPMTGVLAGKGYHKDKLTRFGYMQCISKRDGLIGKAGTVLKGHEFHYWDCTYNGADCYAGKPIPVEGTSGFLCGTEYEVFPSYECMIHTERMLAGFPHFYYYSNPRMIYEFLKKCDDNKEV